MVAGVPLLGRDRDVDGALSRLAATGRCSVVGPGGIGKTSLAAAIAARSGLDPVWVHAEPVDTTVDLAVALVAALGGEIIPGEDPIEAACATVESRRVLVVVDGAEHLDGVEAFVERIPVHPDAAWLLLTTRRLGAPAPVLQLRPLDVDGAAADLLAVLLDAFGGPVLAEGDLTALVARTGGLPLALELLARRIAETGDDGFGASDVSASSALDPVIEASVRRSLALVDDAAARCFRVLGLTATAVTPAFAAGITGTAVDDATTHLVRLRQLGLVVGDGGVVDLLPPVRDAALELLVLAGEVDGALDDAASWAIRLNHDAWSVAGHQDVIGRNVDNLLRLGWLAVRHRRPAALRLAHAMFDTFHDRLRNQEISSLLTAALALPDDDAELEADAARRAALVASECASMPVALRWLDRADDAAERSGGRAGLRCRIEATRAVLAHDAGDLRRSRSAAELSVRLSEGVDRADSFFGWQSRHQLSVFALEAGDLDECEEHAQACVDWGRTSEVYIAHHGLVELAWAALERGRWADAAARARQLREELQAVVGFDTELAEETRALELAAEPTFGGALPTDRRDLPWWLRLSMRTIEAGAAPIDERWDEVLRIAADVAALADATALVLPGVSARLLLGDAALAGGERRQAQQAYEQALRDSARSGYRPRAADALDGSAALAREVGLTATARQATGLADAVRAWCGAHPRPRPSLPARPTLGDRPPTGWIEAGVPTAVAIDAITAPLAAGLLDAATSHPVWSRLTRSEREIAQHAAAGASNNEIAALLFVSRRTVESHLQRVYRKLDVRSRSQLAALAARGESR